MNLKVTCSSYPANLVKSCLCKEGKCTRQGEKEAQSVTFAAGCLRKYFLFLYNDVCWASALWNILKHFTLGVRNHYNSRFLLINLFHDQILCREFALFPWPSFKPQMQVNRLLNLLSSTWDCSIYICNAKWESCLSEAICHIQVPYSCIYSAIC